MDQLRQIAELTEAVFVAKQSGVRALLGREREIESMLAEISTQIERRRRSIDEEWDPAQQAGADPLWEAWIEKRRAKLNMSLARVRAERLEAIEGLREAFGRYSAARELAKTGKITNRAR